MDSALKQSIVREASLLEVDFKFPDFAQPMWCGVIEEDGRIVGHIFCSELYGKQWLHDLEHHGTDKTAVKRLKDLWQTALPRLGVREVLGEYRDRKQMEIALSDGWEIESIVLRRAV